MFLNIAIYLKTVWCGCGSVAVIFSLYLISVILYVYECALLERWVYVLCFVSCSSFFLLISCKIYGKIYFNKPSVLSEAIRLVEVRQEVNIIDRSEEKFIYNSSISLKGLDLGMGNRTNKTFSICICHKSLSCDYLSNVSVPDNSTVHFI